MALDPTAIGLLTASSVLYGFAIAYYAFARNRQASEQFESETRAIRDRWSERQLPRKQLEVQGRTLMSDVGIVAASLVYLVAALGPFSTLFLSTVVGAQAVAFLEMAATAASFVLLIGVVTVLVSVGVANYRETKEQMRETRGRLERLLEREE